MRSEALIESHLADDDLSLERFAAAQGISVRQLPKVRALVGRGADAGTVDHDSAPTSGRTCLSPPIRRVSTWSRLHDSAGSPIRDTSAVGYATSSESPLVNGRRLVVPVGWLKINHSLPDLVDAEG